MVVVAGVEGVVSCVPTVPKPSHHSSVNARVRMFPAATSPLAGLNFHQAQLRAGCDRAYIIVASCVQSERLGCLGDDWMRQLAERMERIRGAVGQEPHWSGRPPADGQIFFDQAKGGARATTIHSANDAEVMPNGRTFLARGCLRLRRSLGIESAAESRNARRAHGGRVGA